MKEGGTVYISCQKPSGAPSPSISFIHNGSIVVPDARRRVIDGGVRLTIGPLQMSDNGVYQCMAGNPAGVVKSKTFTITVQRELDQSLRHVARPQLSIVEL
eukprot:sb/3478551/